MTDIVTPTAIPLHATALPDPSDRGTFTTRGLALFQYETGTMVPGMNTLSEQTHTNATAAFEAAEAALINANYKGAWSSLTGALNKPALVSHSGSRWNLLNNLANVTTSTPGVSADWELYQLPAATGVAFNNAGTSVAATTVQAALVEVSADADAALMDFENPILNGDMRVAQAGTSFAVIAGSKTFVLDGWEYGGASAAALTVAQTSGATPVNENAKWLTATVTTADAAVAATDYAHLQHRIEGYEVAAYVNQTFTLGFWVKASVTGLYTVAMRNGVDRYYLATFTVAVANTPQFVSITVTGGLPATGTWNFTDGLGLALAFNMQAGTNFHGTSGAWNTGSTLAVAGQVNALGTIGNAFSITDVQINPGTVAKRFKRPTYPASLARCQRCYEVLSLQVGEDTTASTKGNGHSWKVEKRIAPNLTVANGSGPNSSATVTFAIPGGDSKTGIYQSSGTSIGTVGAYGNKLVAGDARL